MACGNGMWTSCCSGSNSSTGSARSESRCRTMPIPLQSSRPPSKKFESITGFAFRTIHSSAKLQPLENSWNHCRETIVRSRFTGTQKESNTTMRCRPGTGPRCCTKSVSTTRLTSRPHWITSPRRAPSFGQHRGKEVQRITGSSAGRSSGSATRMSSAIRSGPGSGRITGGRSSGRARSSPERTQVNSSVRNAGISTNPKNLPERKPGYQTGNPAAVFFDARRKTGSE